MYEATAIDGDEQRRMTFEVLSEARSWVRSFGKGWVTLDGELVYGRW